MQQSDATRPLAQNTERAGWRLKPPATLLHLNDALLSEYRHPSELPMLWLSLVVSAILLVGLILFKHKAILLGVAGSGWR